MTLATPNIFNPVTVRRARVHELSGRVTLDGTAAGGGVRLLLERASGEVVQQIVTFADGSYTFDRVFVGDYRLRVDGAALTTLNAHGDAITVHVPAAAPVPLRLLTINRGGS